MRAGLARSFQITSVLKDFSTGHNIVASVFVEVGAMYRASGPAAQKPVGEVEFANPRAYENQIERFGGKATLYAVRFNEWLSTLLHGRPLAVTVEIGRAHV